MIPKKAAIEAIEVLIQRARYSEGDIWKYQSNVQTSGGKLRKALLPALAILPPSNDEPATTTIGAKMKIYPAPTQKIAASRRSFLPRRVRHQRVPFPLAELELVRANTDGSSVM